MMRRKYFDAAQALVDGLASKQAGTGISDREMGRQIGLTNDGVAKWRRHERQPHLSGIIAWADALGMEIVVRERQP